MNPNSNLDPNLIISLSALVLSVAGPIFTALINNMHQRKLRKLEQDLKAREDFHLKKRTVYENFLRSAGLTCLYPDEETYGHLGENFYAIYLYTPSDLHPQIDAFVSLMAERALNTGDNATKANNMLIDLSKQLYAILQSESQLPTQTKCRERTKR